MTNQQLIAKSFALRRDIVEVVHHAKAGHIGGDLSMIDILTTLYLKQMNVSSALANDPDRDRFVLSKGHSVEALYVVLAEAGFFPKESLKELGTFGTKFIGHPTRAIPGIEMNSGSLGHGLPLAVGMALAGKMDKKDYRVYTILGDGELAEGSVWEGVMAGSHYKLDNLTAIVDRNGLQISGTTEQVLSQSDQAARWRSFGWHAIDVSGNDIIALNEAFEEAKRHKSQPTVLIAHTTKGSGVSFMENQAGWHHRVPTNDELKQAIEELTAKEVAAL